MTTTNRDFEIFVKASRVWADQLGLHDWMINYYHGPLEDALANCASDASGHVASITLNTNWPEHYQPSRDRLSATAFHELCHVLLAELTNAARERVMTDNMIRQMEHSVIRRLERFALA